MRARVGCVAGVRARVGCVAGVRAVRGWDVWQVKGTRRGVTSVLL